MVNPEDLTFDSSKREWAFSRVDLSESADCWISVGGVWWARAPSGRTIPPHPRGGLREAGLDHTPPPYWCGLL